MASLFHGISGIGGSNPFATPVGQLVDQATDASLASENWGLNMEICDVINETDEGPKDAMKAIKKKLSMNVGKNYTVIMYTLTVLETCVKNCGRRFHLQVANKDFLQELIKIISPKNDPPTVVQEKILSLIQTWADAFRGQPDMREVDKVYQDLKKKGIEFPMTDLDSLAPIHTPARTFDGPLPQTMPPPARTMPQQHQPLPQQQQPAPPVGGDHVSQAPPGPVHLNPEQLGKLRSELDVVQQNCKVFSEMLTELTPGNEEPSDLELLQELHRTCRQMQQRVVELVNRVSNEECTGELLRINDDLNNVFLRYERFERYRSGQAGHGANPAVTSPVGAVTGVPPPIASQPVASQPAGDSGIGNLIDLDDTTAPSQPTPQPPSVQQRLAAVQISQQPSAAAGSTNGDDEFDMFAASRQSFDTGRTTAPSSAYPAQQQDQTGSLSAAVHAKTTGDNVEDLASQVKDKDSDYDEMQKWLHLNKQANAESATSSEFDAFLAQRAQEVDQLPDINATNNRPRGNRQMQSAEENDNTLFSL